jgi:gliding motility-associated-like protein
LELCDYEAPPLIFQNFEVNHVLGPKVLRINDLGSTWYCVIPNQYISNDLPMIHLGTWLIDSLEWNPFWYEIYFSKPVKYMEFLIHTGSTGFMEIDYGAENFVFEAECVSLDLSIVHACNALIEGDTIYLGVGNEGSGIFSLSFSEPVQKFKISGKGGGNGSGFMMCKNSIVQAPLWASMSAPIHLCNKSQVQFTAYGTSPPYTFTYSINGGSPQSIQTTGSNSSVSLNVGLGTTFPQTGPYEIELLSITDSDGNTEFLTCNNTAIINVHNEEPPLAQFTTTPSTGFVPLQVTTQNQSSNATEYEWLVNGGWLSGAEAPTLTLEEPNTYEITLIASNALGCTDTARQTIHVLEELQVVIPNVFTPNNDGINDWFGITANVSVPSSVVILNRWGNVVFEKKFVTTAGDFVELWDGASTGSVTTPGSVTVPDGVYFYRIVLDGEGWREEFSGFVTVKK